MKRLRLAIVGSGRLGRACAEAAFHAHDLERVGVVVREPSATRCGPESVTDRAQQGLIVGKTDRRLRAYAGLRRNTQPRM